ncbi:hypothetical protein E2P71_10880 [Candidatus Bathyarchaeota archaeon]|nr:hypothetical protein E2P71_10880 [Candidatus Bathyarchaeota archaeon]
MSEAATLVELQIKRRELENELASLSETEKLLKSDLRTLEARIIQQLKAEIEAKKSALNCLESRKNDLEQKLNELQENPASWQKPTVPVDVETDAPVQ